jgi:hypothetical protein
LSPAENADIARATEGPMLRMCLVLLLSWDVSAAAQTATRPRAGASGRPAARWIGQDGHDLVGPSPAPAPAPNDVQDVRIALSGLPPNRKVVGAVVQGLGGGEWRFNEPGNSWRAEFVRTPGSPSADLYFEVGGPENGRNYTVRLRFDDGRTLELPVRGGRADPNLRMPTAALGASWTGQDGRDRVGRGPSVGPDGLQDVALSLRGLSPKAEIEAVAVDAPGLPGWRSGTNPEGRDNAELIRPADAPERAEVLLQPASELKAGVTLAVTVTYRGGKTDRATLAAGRFDPDSKASVPPSSYRRHPAPIAARWIGQEAPRAGVEPGLVRVELSGLPRDRTLAALALSDPAGIVWSAHPNPKVAFTPEPGARPLLVRRRPDPSRADLWLAPARDESGSSLTLRVVYDDGSTALADLAGGAADVSRRAGPPPAATATPARPGSDLHAMVARGGTIRLAKGVHALDRPLRLPRPVRLVGEPGAILEFRPRAGSPPWPAAVVVGAGNVTLENLAIRFAGPVPWRKDIPYGPAVISTPVPGDPPPAGPLVGLAFLKLDLSGPPSAGAAPWEEAVRLFRLAGADGGRIEGCTLKGGMIELWGGPWTIAGNAHLGTPPGTFSHAVVAAHEPHDLAVRDNTTEARAPHGKTWRFLVLTGTGYRDVIEGNRVAGIGPRDDDSIPSMNAPEIVLTESYRLHFEGRPAAVLDGGKVLLIPAPQGEPARAGAVVAILSGPQAGTYHRVAQAIDARTYVISPPLPAGAESQAVSLASGFVDEAFVGNTIDSRGGSVAVNLVLVGNHFGTKVQRNRLLGGGDAFKVAACPSEAPVHWGWSHAPMLGIDMSDNVIEDAPKGGLVAVEHGPPVKSSRGRVYFSGSFRRNVAAWSMPPKPPAVAFTLGDAGSLDPAELVLATEANAARVPPGSPPAVLRVPAAQLDGRAVKGQEIALPAAKAP